jgi:uncharacterized CHY-type Zn-finger protein
MILFALQRFQCCQQKTIYTCVQVTFPMKRHALIVASSNTTVSTTTMMAGKSKTTMTYSVMPAGNVSMVMPAGISEKSTW